MNIRTPDNRKFFYAMLGLPSSGTTIISRFFHSLENGFCVAEPFHRTGLMTGRVVDLDKVGPLPLEGTPAEFLTRLHTKLLDSPYAIGGIKEVDLAKNGHARRWSETLSYNGFDGYILIHREPKALYQSIRNREKDFGVVDLQAFLNTWHRFHAMRQTLQADGKRVIDLSYEQFCLAADPVSIVSAAFGPDISFQGSFQLAPVQKAFWIVTDRTAVLSKSLNQPKQDFDQLSTDEQQSIDAECRFEMPPSARERSARSSGQHQGLADIHFTTRSVVAVGSHHGTTNQRPRPTPAGPRGALRVPRGADSPTR